MDVIKNRFSIIIGMLLLGTACHSREQHMPIETIRIACDEAIRNCDLSDLFCDSLDVIRLETNEGNLLSAQSKFIFADDYILAADRRGGVIALFDAQGKHLTNIGQRGRGPGEYFSLGDVAVSEGLIYIQDAGRERVLVYDFSNNFIRDIALDPPVFYVEMTVLDRSLFLITNYIGIDGREFNVAETDLEGRNMRLHLPFREEIERKKLSWGLDNHLSDSGDTTLMILSRCDTVYTLAENKVTPRYRVDFGRHEMAFPKGASGSEVLSESIENNRTCGLSGIHHSKRFLLGTFGLGEYVYYFVYDKMSKETLISDSFVVDKFGGLPVPNTLTTTKDGSLVLIYESYMLREICKNSLEYNEIADTAVKSRLTDLASVLDDEMNPVCIKLRFK